MTKIRKINPINGRKRGHSFLRGAGLFVANLETQGLIGGVQVSRFEPYHGPPRAERIEVVGGDCHAKLNYLQIRYFSGQNSQKIKLYAPKEGFIDIMNAIIEHCSRR
jgi:hypothetical protein